MPDTTYHMCGFASGLNWRPVKFMQRLDTTRVCRLCGVVPQSIAVLPCAHLMCGSCLDGCASEGGHACPLDKISFVAESDVSWTTLHQKRIEKLQVCCWNTHNGCGFVGPAGELLDHFEKRCSFHATRCPRCRDAVLRKDLPRHYEAGCNGVASLQLSVAWHVSSIDVATPNANDEPAVDCSCHDMLTSIQGRVNDLAETMANSAPYNFKRKRLRRTRPPPGAQRERRPRILCMT
ncbi:TNF receptor-associated factor 3-like [Dermacentor albipictus]|uniref:TNF receptor-associated factor 3-like n=1 Tax=Dermacentor albipictus TaxID=60249 RepID=UPI0031FD8F35